MKALAIIVNLFLPGFGTLFVKKWGQAVAQIILGIIGAVLVVTGVGAIIGIPLIIGAWIWSIVTAVNAPSEPVTIVVKNQ